jgi:hypothetical protein
MAVSPKSTAGNATARTSAGVAKSRATQVRVTTTAAA